MENPIQLQDALTAPVNETLEKYLGVRNRHRELVDKGRKTELKLHQVGALTREIEMFAMTPRGDQLSSFEQSRILNITEAFNIDQQLAQKVIFGDAELERKGLLSECRDIMAGITPKDRNRYTVGQRIVDTIESLIISSKSADVQQIKDLLFSQDRQVPVPTTQGILMATPRELFTQYLSKFPERLAQVQKTVVGGYLSEHDMAVYDAYYWTKTVSKRVASGEISSIFPTPYTESVKEAMRVAFEKRNGLLKYILFGDAGVGKTRLIMETDRERGKQTVVVNFHHFVSFDELIGHTAITVDLGGNNNLERLNNVVNRFVDTNQTNDNFWADMQNVYDHLPTHIKEKYKSVEKMVDGYGKGLYGTSSPIDNSEESLSKEEIRSRFQQRIKAIRDNLLLGFTEDDLQSRFVKGAILKAIKEGKAVCFDEMDKAGPHAIEGMLSFLALSPGETWHFQGGEVFIPHDFYITATSNARGIGSGVLSGKTNDEASKLFEEMNRYLADRCEQIEVDPQPVKDSLMIASVLLSDQNGGLLLNEREQMQLIATFSYIIPKLQEAHLPIPITNRIINTICSRLVDFRMTDNKQRAYYRTERTVPEAVRLSVLSMKGTSLGPEGQKKVEEILNEFMSLLGTDGQISKFGEELPFYIPDSGKRGDSAIEGIWGQPLYQAIASLQSKELRLIERKLQEIDNALIPHVALQDMIKRSDSLQLKLLGRGNGFTLKTTQNGVILESIDPVSGIAIGNKIVSPESDRNYAQASILAADQLGDVFAIKKASGDTLIVANGTQIHTISGSEKSSIYIDPKGKFFVIQTDQGLSAAKIDGSNRIKLENLASNARLVDLSPDGNYLAYKDNSGLHLIDLTVLTGGKKPNPINLTYPEWFSARFLNNHLLAGLTEQNNIARDEQGRCKIITIV